MTWHEVVGDGLASAKQHLIDVLRCVEHLTSCGRLTSATVALHPPGSLIHRSLLPCWRDRLLKLREIVLVTNGLLSDESSIVCLANILISSLHGGFSILCASSLACCASEDVIVWLVLWLASSVGEVPLVLVVVVSRFRRLMLIVDVVSAIL